MQRLLFTFQWICLSFLSTFSFSQTLKSPTEFLEYPLGSQFTYHFKVNEYLNYLSNETAKIEYIPYGKTEEGRPLFVLAISSKENIINLEEIRVSNLKRAGFIDGEPNYDKSIVWLGYNVHGNEASGSEVAMKVAYELTKSTYDELLKEIIVIIDPCLNPDGRDRYVNNFKAKQGTFINSNPSSWEHVEPWPSGRFNHYLFDLNRDWAWLTQKETRLRNKIYRKWYPHVFVDYHEMMPQYSYFFGPSADPIHNEVTSWQRKYHKIASEKYSKYFEDQDWEYFSEKVFDLLYPSYGDSWTCFNGAVGFTFEQGGHGVAGLSYKSKKSEEEITLEGRIKKHYETSMLTLILAVEYKENLLSEFEAFFNSNKNSVKNYIIKSNVNNAYNIEYVTNLLKEHGIECQKILENKEVEGYSYIHQEIRTRKVQKGDILLSTNQKQGKALKVLFEPKAIFTDSTTYDLTAWSLPYAFGLDVIETEVTFENTEEFTVKKSKPYIDEDELTDSTFFILEWESLKDIKYVAELLNKGIKVGYLGNDIIYEESIIKKGTLLLPYFGLSMSKTFTAFKETTEIYNINYRLIHFDNSGIDQNIKIMDKPLITIVGGEGVNPVRFGSLWHYFDKVLHYPVDIEYKSKLTSFDLLKSNTLILCDGEYGEKYSKMIELFMDRGGKVILLEDAIKVSFDIHELEMSKKLNKIYKEDNLRDKDKIENKALGCIIETELPADELITKGLSTNYYLIKENAHHLPLLNHGYNIGVVNKSEPVSGYMGYNLQKIIKGTSLISAEKFRKGEVYYFVDDPLIRGFWGNGMHLLANAIFFDLNKK